MTAAADYPDWIKTLPVWLMWRLEGTRKVPHYASGIKRHGTLDSPEDRAQLVTFDRLQLRDDFIPGIALGPLGDGTSLCLLDLDDVNDASGERSAGVAPCVDAAMSAGALAARSIGGDGVHVVWRAREDELPDAHGARALETGGSCEVYTGRRFAACGRQVFSPGTGDAADLRLALELLPLLATREQVERTESQATRRVSEGGRNAHLWVRRLQLHEAGVTDPDVLFDALLDINESECDPPLSESEVRSTVGRPIADVKRKVRSTPQQSFDVVPCGVWQPVAIGDRVRVTEAPPPVEFVWRGWLQRRKVGLIASAGGEGKTTFLIWLAVHIVLGRPCLGHAIDTPGPVLLLSRDDDQDDVDAVVREICRAMELTPDEQATVSRSLYVHSLVDDAQFMLIAPNGQSYKPSPFVPVLQGAIEKLRPVAVMVDTVRQFSGIESANEAGQITFMAVCKTLTTWGAAVIAAHHVGKDAARKQIVDMYSAVGSSALADNARFMWRLLRVDAGEAGSGVALPDGAVLAPGSDLLQLISTRGSIRVRAPADVFYTRRGYRLEPVAGARPKTAAERQTAADAQMREDIITLLRASPPMTAYQIELQLTGRRDRRRGVIGQLVADGVLIAAGKKGPGTLLRLAG